jgi:NADPH-dependent curcumin reductase CurA
MTVNRRFLLTARPKGVPLPADFTLAEALLPRPAEGQALLRNIFLSLDPGVRGWMDEGQGYLPPIPLGQPMRGLTLGQVVESRTEALPVGAYVVGMHEWADFALAEPGWFTRVVAPVAGLPLSAHLSVLGPPGLTAYFGVTAIGRPKPGETLLVSAAAGAVGSLAGQIGRIAGCRVLGIAGGPEKCRRLVTEFGFDGAIDYREHAGYAALDRAIAEACPGGLDIYFDNVGGEMLDAALHNLRHGSRIVLCGMIAGYNAGNEATPLRNAWQAIVHSARIEGFLTHDFQDRFAEATAELGAWVRAGRLTWREHIDHGLENAVASFGRLFDGSNQGKLLLQIADP